MIDKWYPSRTDPENCPMDYFIAKYVVGIERDKISPSNAKMTAGKEVHNAMENYLSGIDKTKAINDSKERLRLHYCLDDRDRKQLDICMHEFDAVFNNTLLAVEQCKIKPTDIEIDVEANVMGLERPVGGIIDVMEKDIINEFKTKWSSPFLKKDGTFSERSAPQIKEPTHGYVRQASMYHHGSGKPVRIICATAKGYQVFDQNNCDFLSQHSLDIAFETMRISARARENFLKMSESGEVLARYVPLNLSHYAWSNIDATALQQVKQVWGYRNVTS